MNKQLPLSIQLNTEATLADFCWGNNGVLQQQLMLSFTGMSERLFYIWGNAGSGKSHLLQACCQYLSNSQSAIYLPLEILNSWGPRIIDGLEEQLLVCIDDVETIANQPEWEEALFHLFNRAKENERTILIITGKLPPSQLHVRLPDLKSRLSWGLVMQINELEDEDKIATLKIQAAKRGFVLPLSVGQFLINRCSRNMHDLLGLLNRLDEASLIAQRKITIPFVKDILGI